MCITKVLLNYQIAIARRLLSLHIFYYSNNLYVLTICFLNIRIAQGHNHDPYNGNPLHEKMRTGSVLEGYQLAADLGFLVLASNN